MQGRETDGAGRGATAGGGRTVRPLQRAIAGWSSRLAALVGSLLLFQAVTGIWIYLAPFSVAAQIQVLAHTAVGFAVLVPCAVHQARHVRAWYRQKLSADQVLGYALLASTVACFASGLVATWEGAAGLRLSAAWNLVHLVSGLAVGVLLVVHVALVLARRLPAARSSAELARAMRSFGVRTLSLGSALAAAIVVLAATNGQRPVELDAPEGYTLPAYAQEFDEYRGSVFAPTYARTESGKLLDPSVLSGSESCGTAGCHEEILAEWQPSAHRFSAMNPPFQQVQRNFAADREPAETRYCAGCHDPISLFAGAKDIQMLDHQDPGFREGVSCAVCHSISSVDRRGNADYVLTPPSKYLWEGADGWRKQLSDFLIRAYPRQHLADYDRNLLRSPEFCGACHKQFIPEALNRFGASPSQNQYDEWRRSHWHTDDPETDLSCRDCHMRLVYDSFDPGRGEGGDARRAEDDGAHRHHGTIATNALMPEVLKLPHWEEQVRLTREWVAGETVLPEIADVWPAGPVVALDLLAPEEARPGEAIELRVVVTNRKVGHNFTTGPLDFVRSWVHLTVTDAAGAVLAEWGSIDPETRRIEDEPGRLHELGNSRSEGTLVLEAQPLDEHGERLLRHELWRKAGGEGQRTIFPRYSDQQTYAFVVPAGARGPLTVRANLEFRRYRQEFLDLVVPDMERTSGVVQPTLRQAGTARAIRVLRADAAPAAGAR